MEIWGGNRATEKTFRAPGVDVYVYSQPFQGSQTGGGDIYYLTSCASGRISRMLLADVSGHGEAASSLAVSLKNALRASVNRINQQQLVSRLNTKFAELTQSTGFATAVVATYFNPKKTLQVNLAGHPYPFYYRAAKQRWYQLNPNKQQKGLENLPWGVRDDVLYPGRNLRTGQDDLFLLYSDAFTEAVNDQGRVMGMSGLVELLNSRKYSDPSSLISNLRRDLTAFSPDNLGQDDATLVLCHFTHTKIRLRDSLLAPFRMTGKVADKTQLGN